VAAVAHAVDGDGVGGLIEENAVITDAEPKQSVELSAERLDSARAGFGVAVDRIEDGHGGALVDAADLGRHVGLESDSLHGASVVFGTAANLIHCEAVLGNNLLEGEALAALVEVLARSRDGPAVFVGQFIVIVDHDFQQRAHHAQFGGR
jgi:hypothetical protein